MECVFLMVMAVGTFFLVRGVLKWEDKQVQKQLDTFYKAIEDGLEQRAQPALAKAKDKGFWIKYGGRSWSVALLPPTDRRPYHSIQVMTREFDLPPWCAMHLNAAGDFRFEVKKQLIRIDPQQCDYPDVRALQALHQYSDSKIPAIEVLKIYPEYALMSIYIKTIDDAGEMAVDMIRDFSDAINAVHLNADLGAFWYAVCSQSSPHDEVGRVALGALAASYMEHDGVPELWLSRLTVMDDRDVMALVIDASAKAQVLFFKQHLPWTQWLDYAQVGLSLPESRAVVKKCIELAHSQMYVDELDALNRRYRKVFGLLFLRFWTTTKTTRFLVAIQPWWPLMPDEQLVDCMAAVIADTPHLVEWWMFEPFVDRWTRLKHQHQDTVARWFAGRIAKSTQWLENPACLSTLIKMLPHFDRSDARTVFDTFVEHASPKQHYAPMYKAISAQTGRPESPAVRLFRPWFESLKDDPRMLGALSVSDGADVHGALTDVNVTEGQLSASTQESS